MAIQYSPDAYIPDFNISPLLWKKTDHIKNYHSNKLNEHGH